jgi:hypothetical protein
VTGRVPGRRWYGAATKSPLIPQVGNSADRPSARCALGRSALFPTCGMRGDFVAAPYHRLPGTLPVTSRRGLARYAASSSFAPWIGVARPSRTRCFTSDSSAATPAWLLEAREQLLAHALQQPALALIRAPAHQRAIRTLRRDAPLDFAPQLVEAEPRERTDTQHRHVPARVARAETRQCEREHARGRRARAPRARRRTCSPPRGRRPRGCRVSCLAARRPRRAAPARRTRRRDRAPRTRTGPHRRSRRARRRSRPPRATRSPRVCGASHRRASRPTDSAG